MEIKGDNREINGDKGQMFRLVLTSVKVIGIYFPKERSDYLPLTPLSTNNSTCET